MKDIDAQQRFWTQLGGTPVDRDKLQMMQFPGIFIVLRKQDSTGGTVGSVINHFGLHVKNLNDFMPKWKAAGIPIEPGNNPKQMFLTGPDDVRVEIIEDASIPTPVAMHHIHMFLPDPLGRAGLVRQEFRSHRRQTRHVGCRHRSRRRVYVHEE